jgi:hypothetical protein
MAQQLTTNGGFEGLESPDSKLLYYVKSPGNAEGLWSVPITGGLETRIPVPARWSMWDVGNQGIYYADYSPTESNTPSKIKLYRFDTRQTMVIGVLTRSVARPNAGVNSGFSVSPDGRSLLFVCSDRSESELMLVEGFR